ncbi:MAG: class II fumarate hydratase [Bacteroidales bacterium]|nr:class II fumarate hydratase [Bacteroidales bacterium]MDD4216526.1 class II fumarate hydratase [Bacteroidales bacterium]MDY0141436.1 class II fumarate hydratase [Bacteroidales bacterium]
MKYREEHDTMGIVKVPVDKYWGAQTQRSFQNFKIGDKMPIELIKAYAYLKKACALANMDKGKLSKDKAVLISRVCDLIIDKKLNDQFPLVVWQTGSGTQTNMNLNEVIANYGHVLNGGKLVDKIKVLHPNDDVNKSQSSNDTFPTAMSIAAIILLTEELIPAVEYLKDALKLKSKEFKNIIKVGRTHMMDATPISFAQEFSGYVSQLEHALSSINNSIPHLLELAIGGTAVGTGLNAPAEFDKAVCNYLNTFTGKSFIPADNKFEALASNDSFVETHSALKLLAVSLNKIANDFRLMGSGPRCGLAELNFPANEPGSSIMPGKINPTQIEALTMVCAQVIGNDIAITIGAMNGQFELNVYKPLIIKNFVESSKLLSQALDSFTENCVKGISINIERIKYYFENSLMNVTALNETLGYEKAAIIAKTAFAEGLSLRQAAIKCRFISEEDFDKIMKPKKLI